MFKLKFSKNSAQGPGCVLFMIVVWVYAVVSYLINIYQLVVCDWDSTQPWKNEIIHLIGLVPPCNLITVWF